MRARHLAASIHLALAALAAGCGAKTGLDVPRIPPCEEPPAVVPEACPALSLGATVSLETEVTVRSIFLFTLHRGIWALVRSDDDRDHAVLLGADARPITPGLDVPHPFGDGLGGFYAAADGCLPVMSLGTYGDVAPSFTPGRCAILPLGADRWTAIAGTYDRCIVVGIDPLGIEMSLTNDEREVRRRVALDGTFVGPGGAVDGGRPPLSTLSSSAGETSVDLVPARRDALAVTSPDGETTVVALGGPFTSLGFTDSTAIFTVDGATYVLTLDGAGRPRPLERREELGTEILGVEVQTVGTTLWMSLWRAEGTVLVPIDERATPLGPELPIELDAPSFAPFEDGMVIVGLDEDGRASSLAATCVSR